MFRCSTVRACASSSPASYQRRSQSFTSEKDRNVGAADNVRRFVCGAFWWPRFTPDQSELGCVMLHNN